MKILIIEDQKELAESISTYLKGEGYVCEQALDFESADLKVHLHEYDCLVVDITLPGGSGLDIIRQVKKEKVRAGIIIISAKNSIDDKISGLEIGADDYLTKPFHLAELNARIKSVIRRKSHDGDPSIEFNEIEITPETMEVRVKGNIMDLTRKEYDLLTYFIANRERVLTKGAIAEHLWGDYMEQSDSFDFIYTHIKNLRKKLMDCGAADYIKTVYGMGYKFTDK